MSIHKYCKSVLAPVSLALLMIGLPVMAAKAPENPVKPSQIDRTDAAGDIREHMRAKQSDLKMHSFITNSDGIWSKIFLYGPTASPPTKLKASCIYSKGNTPCFIYEKDFMIAEVVDPNTGIRGKVVHYKKKNPFFKDMLLQVPSIQAGLKSSNVTVHDLKVPGGITTLCNIDKQLKKNYLGCTVRIELDAANNFPELNETNNKLVCANYTTSASALVDCKESP